MERLSFVMPFYRNPVMLARHFENWRSYPVALKDRVEIVIVDDGSPKEPAAAVPRPDGLPPIRIYRVLVDIPWHQHGARNLGALVAEGPWLLLTDMDHMMPADDLGRLMRHDDRERIYTFDRVEPDGSPTLRKDGRPKHHPNSFAMTKAMYWDIGGYDESFVGIYGTDALYRERAFMAGRETFLPDVALVRYHRDIINDASTRYLPRKEGRDPGAKKKAVERKRAEGREHEIKVLAFPWAQVV